MNLRSLGIIRPKDVPTIDVELVECAQPNAPYGIKGVGEIGLVPTAGAVAAALHDFDGEWRTRLPMRATTGAPPRDDGREGAAVTEATTEPGTTGPGTPEPGTRSPAPRRASSARTTTSTRRSPAACRPRRRRRGRSPRSSSRCGGGSTAPSTWR